MYITLNKLNKAEIKNLSRSELNEIEAATDNLPTKNVQVQIDSLMVFTRPSRTNSNAS